MPLTEQERERIIEEEKLRAEIRKQEMSGFRGHGMCPHCGRAHFGPWGIAAIVLGAILLLFILFGRGGMMGPWHGWHMGGYYGDYYRMPPGQYAPGPGPAPAPPK